MIAISALLATVWPNVGPIAVEVERAATPKLLLQRVL